jgi:hypothetical protein
MAHCPLVPWSGDLEGEEVARVMTKWCPNQLIKGEKDDKRSEVVVNR